MIYWNRYPNPAAGQYAYHEGLTLTAKHDGSWAVFSLGRNLLKNSDMAPIVYPENERNLEAAKLKAEQAAEWLLNPSKPAA